MTFGDGIVGVYELTEVRKPGKMPVDTLVQTDKFCFGYETLGINRYYTAMQAKQQIEAVISIPGWNDIKANRHIAVIADPDGELTEDCDQFRIVMAQPTHDEDGLRITRLSLERLGEKYAAMS